VARAVNSETLLLKPDSIVEALLELRFESSDVAEYATGKLLQFSLADGFAVARLPVADIPAPIRTQDPTLVHQPILEMRSTDAARVAKVGERTFSWHILGAYPGWAAAQPEFEKVIRHVFGAMSNVNIKRIGMRYVNMFMKDRHKIIRISDLNISVMINGNELIQPFNLNYIARGEGVTALVRLASPEFVAPSKSGMSALVDIDVSIEGDKVASDVDGALKCIETSHDFLKEQYTKFLTPDMRRKLEGEG